MTKITQGERAQGERAQGERAPGERNRARASVLGAAAVLVTALAGCSAISGSSSTASSTSSGTSATAAATTATTPAVGGTLDGQLTVPRDGAQVAREQAVNGVATSLPAGDKAWIVIYPVKAPAYWPQQGPLQLDSAGDFRSTAVFGSTATQNIGERFVVRLVITNAAATARFRAFLADPSHGLTKMPAGARTLSKVTVIRG